MSVGPAEAADAAAGDRPHEHVHRLVAVHLEDRTTTRELVCDTCGAVWFT